MNSGFSLFCSNVYNVIMKKLNYIKKYIGVLAVLFVFVQTFSHADLSSTLKLLGQVREVEKSSAGLLAVTSGLRASIDLIYKNII